VDFPVFLFDEKHIQDLRLQLFGFGISLFGGSEWCARADQDGCGVAGLWE
jgi:hypothetical protein